MKFRNFFFAAVAAAFAFVSCEEASQNLGTPEITISTDALAFEISGGEQEITLNATRDWQAEATVDWLIVSPESGKASSDGQKITITALENPGATRSTVVNFTIGKMGSRTLTVSQTGPDGSGEPDVPVVSGEGTEANPYLASEAMIVASEMDQSETRDNVYVKGIVAQIKEAYSEQYGNISYYITDDGKAIDTKQMFLIYRGKYFDGNKFTSADQLKVGDEVVVAGTLQNYYGNTPELIAGNRIVKLNGATSGNEGDNGNEGGVTPPVTGDGIYDPGVTWTLGANAYDCTGDYVNSVQTALVNGVEVANLLKLGTGSKVGDATINLPAGTKKLGFYCIAWKGKTSTEVKFTAGSTVLATLTPKANDGASNNPKYTITLTEEDYYTVDVPDGTTAVKVETTNSSQGRVLFIGLKALTE